MRVRALALTNIKRHQGTLVLDPLPAGVVLFLGRNGRGKTTVPQALSLAVFGSRPTAFRAGNGLVGFVNRQSTAGRIRAVVEYSPEEIYTFDVTLRVGEKGKSGEPSNEVSYDIYSGARSLTDELPRGQALRKSVNRKDFQEFVQELLELPLGAEQLCETLLTPPQTGGLTAFFDLRPADRIKRTEDMLGLQKVRDLGKELRRTYGRIDTGAKRLAEQFGEALEAAEASVEGLAGLRAAHQGTTQAFDALSSGKLRATFNAARGARVRVVGERLVTLDAAIKAQAAAHKRWSKANRLGLQLEQVVQAATQLKQTAEQLAQSQAAEVEAQRLAPQAQQWIAANTAYDVQVGRDRERGQKRSSIQNRRATAQQLVAGGDAREEGRAEELSNIAGQRQTLQAELQALEDQMSDWDDRMAAAVELKGTEEERRADIRVLKDLYTAVAGVGDIEEAEDKLAQVREALRAQRLPDRASVLLALVSGQIEAADLGSDAGEGAGWAAEVQIWLQEANARVQAATTACFGLQQEGGSATQKRDGAAERDAQWVAREAALAADRATDAEAITEARTTLSALQEEAKALELSYETVDAELASARALRDDPTLRTAHQDWLVQREKAGHKAERFAANAAQLALAEAATAAVDVPASERPAVDDLDAWVALRETAQADVLAAQAATQSAGGAVTAAQQAHNDALTQLRALGALERGLVQRLDALSRDRAKVRELKAFNDEVVQRIPGALACRVIEQVSTSANEYFDQVFQQPSEPMTLRWDPSDYTVYVDRETGTIPARHCSGGEKMALGIALNLAILHFMAPDVRWLVLDEPTAGLDKENRGGLRDFVSMLREPVVGQGALFDQLLFISHESELFEGMSDTFLFEDDGVRVG